MIVAGFGFRSNATFDSFRSAFENTRSKHKFSKPLVVAVPQDKVNHNSLIFFARDNANLDFPEAVGPAKRIIFLVKLI